MASLNKVMIIGNLGRDPEVRMTTNGQKVANFSVAVTEKYTDRSGQRQERTEWVNVVCWAKQAEIVEKYLHKGSQVYVEGRLETRSWNDANTGDKRYKTEIRCINFQMLGSRNQNNGGGNYNQGANQSNGGGYNQGNYQENQGNQNSAPDYQDNSDFPPPAGDDLPF